MTKKLLVIVSSLLFIVGCESELDRCIKANVEQMTVTFSKTGLEPVDLNDFYERDRSYQERQEKSNQMWRQIKGSGCSINDYLLDKGNLSPQCTDLIDEWYSYEEAIGEEFRKPALAKKAEEICNIQGIY